MELARYVNAECLHVDREPYDKPNQIFDRAHFDATATGEKDERGIAIGERRWIDDPAGTWECGNGFGNGYDAAFWIDYRKDAPLRAKQTYLAEMDEVDDPSLLTHEYCADGCTELHEYNPPMALEVNFDTAYGYTSPEGFGCSVLHALYIVKVGQWLADRGVKWRWHNEFTGKWHDGVDGLQEFVADGRRAVTWFETVVNPAIMAAAVSS